MFSFAGKREPENHQRFRRAGSDGLRCPASTSCLGRHSCPADRGPNNSSLYPPQAAVVAVALFSRFSNLLLRSRLYALAERKVLLKRNTIGEAVNRRSPKNAFSEAASIFPLRLPLRGLKGASSPFLVGPARRNRWWFSGSLLTSKENISLNEKALYPRATSAKSISKTISGSLLARKREPYSAFFKNSGSSFSISASAFPR